MYDLILRGGTVIDGSGKDAYAADIAISDGRIAAVEILPSSCPAKKNLNITGLTVTPGFIDIHRHADGAVFRPGFGELELSQGLTTIVNGNCGLSAAPIAGAHAQAIRTYLEPITGELEENMPTASVAEYLDSCRDLPLHTGLLVGGGTLRVQTAGYEKEHLSEEDYRAIHRAMEKALAEGALGVSLGLGYAPECFYTTQELIHALEPLRNTEIPLTVHMRQEGGAVIESVEEMMTVARALRCPVHISHLKAMGRSHWGTKIPRALEILSQAREEGLEVDCDVYPYTAGSTQLLHILPPDFLSGGPEATVRRLQSAAARQELAQRIESGEGFDNIAALAGWQGIYLTSLHREENRKYQGKSIAEIAQMRFQTPLDACCDLLVSENGQITMVDFMASEEDIISILQSPLSCLISDSTYPTSGQPHPRVYGSFSRLLQHFVNEKKALTWESAIEKMTAMPAKVLRLTGKGSIAPGMDADMCVFAPTQITERATYENPCQCSQGMTYVIVGGEIALQDGKMTNSRSGKVVRRKIL